MRGGKQMVHEKNYFFALSFVISLLHAHANMLKGLRLDKEFRMYESV